MRLICRSAALAMSVLLLGAGAASAASLHLVSSFNEPIFLTSDPGNPNELFVVEREGRVVRFENETRSVFADLTEWVSCCESERGLLSIALAPDFDSSGRFYAAYTGTTAAGGEVGDVHVDAFRHEGATLVREPLFSVGHSVNANHNGGQLEFGPDGALYVSVGDGGGGGDPFESGQDLGSLLGKILRIEPHAGAKPQIWSYGLRNPWRFSFDRASGDMVIGDVGQSAREEVDVAPSPSSGAVGGNGANYGWNCREGFIAYTNPGASCSGASGFTEPVFDYPHADPGDGSAHGCAITGGYVVRDPSLGGLYGRYVYADFCGGEIRSLVLPPGGSGLASDDRSEGLSVASPVSFGEDSCGRLYAIAQAGSVYRLEGATPSACTTTSVAPLRAVGTTGGTKPKPLRLHLAAARHRTKSGVRLTLTARVSPCAGRQGDAVQLNRGGRLLATKRISRRCLARFRRRIAHSSTFRAVLPDGGYRSQVLTIALAKPRP